MYKGIREEELKNKEVVKYLDVLVDGQYVDELHNPKLKWKGSSNQRVIDVQKSLKQNRKIFDFIRSGLTLSIIQVRLILL